LLKEEKKRGPVTSSNNKQFFTLLSEVFYKYLLLYKKMDQVYDQMAHPQKRLLVRNLLDLIIVRLLEIRAALVDTEISEFYYMDELSYVEKISPSDLDVPIPKFYYSDPTEQLILRDSWYLSISERKAKEEAEQLEMQKKMLTEVQDDSAYADQTPVILIQTMERARQGVIRYRMAKYLHEEESREMSRKQRNKKKRMNVEKAAILIQVSSINILIWNNFCISHIIT
jgi:hypothetical protein